MRDRFAIRPSVGRLLQAVVFCAALLALLALPAAAQQATPCVDCVLFAYTDLNLRKAPSLDAVVLARVPKGAAVRRTAGAEVNGYAPVVYAGIPGWVVALGLVVSPADVEPDTTPAPTPAPTATISPTPTSAPAANQREALSVLNLRSGPAPDAPIIASIPAGGVMTLTGEGAEGGYVTVIYNGTSGWVYADLIGPVS